jgi:NodT family efflux transporter outer membrane factor (OMF) lipoprotein
MKEAGAVSSAVVALACVAGCGSHPTLKAPVHSPLQTQWEQVPEGVSQPGKLAGDKPWWAVFHDPVLDRLMSVGFEHNLDLQQAQARILQARAQRLGAGAALWPDITASTADVYSKTPLLPAGTPTSSFTAAVNASWTVDLFGQLRNQERAAQATLRATEFDRDATQVTLAAQIATEYLQYRLFQLQYAIATRSAESQAEVVRITRLRFEQGAASRLDLEQVVSQLAVTRAAVPQAFEQADAARNTLIALLASTPEALEQELPPSIVADNPQLPTGDPLEVLLTPAEVIGQRPDVHAAEFRLVSAAANLKSALAQRYPQLTLGGLFGSAGTEIGQLMTPGSLARGYSYALTLPIFDFGRIRASIDTADAQQLQAYLAYEQTVRGALQATQTAIVMYAQGVLREKQMRIALESARTAARLARRQYQEGALTLLNVLIAEQAEYNTELTWSDAAAAVAERLVALYQTMGLSGGRPPDVPSVPAPLHQ